MAEGSMFFATTGVGDGVAGGYTHANWTAFLRRLLTGNSPSNGVFKGYGNDLNVSAGTGKVTVDTGAAVVYGLPYENTAALDVTIPTPTGATRIDRIVLRASWSAQTVRITRLAGTEGTGTPPALVQTPNTTYDIPLAQVSVTTGGVITVTSERGYAHTATMVGTNQIDDGSITPSKFQGGAIQTNAIGDRQVTGAKTALQTITDENIADNAAIAHDKINGVPPHDHSGDDGDGGDLPRFKSLFAGPLNWNTSVVNGATTTLATGSIVCPSRGFLIAHAHAYLQCNASSRHIEVYLVANDGHQIAGAYAKQDNGNQSKDYSGAQVVPAAGTYSISVVGHGWDDSGSDGGITNGSLYVQFIPAP